MRFELFLTALPRASEEKITETLAELPKGVNPGIIMKAVELKRVPTVSVAWTDDKRVMNEIMDNLAELGAECRLVDHGSIFKKIATFASERMGAPRYREPEEAEDHSKFIKLRTPRKAESRAVAFMRHALTYALQAVLVSVLYVWYLGIEVGFMEAGSIPGLMPQLGANAGGVLGAYLSMLCVKAMRAGRMSAKAAAPVFAVVATCTVGSLFLLGNGWAGRQAEQAAAIAIKRPPSNPFGGLFSELQRRELSAEIEGKPLLLAGIDESFDTANAEEMDAMLCLVDENGIAPELSECAGGPAWEDLGACLLAPDVTPGPVLRLGIQDLAVEAGATAREHGTEAGATAREDTLRAQDSSSVVAHESSAASRWTVTLGALELESLAGVCLLCITVLFLLERRQAKKISPKSELRASELRSGPNPPASTPAAEPAIVTLPVPLIAQPEDPELPNLRRELALIRGTLAAKEVTLEELKQVAASGTEQREALAAELTKLKRELLDSSEQLDQARSMLLEMRSLALANKAANNQLAEPKKPAVAPPIARAAEGARTPASTPRTTVAAEPSGYSVGGGQEERISLGKRRGGPTG